MYCNKCGQLLKEGDAFCSACGAPQARTDAPEPAEPAAPAVEAASVAEAAPAAPIVDPCAAPQPVVPGSQTQYVSRTEAAAAEAQDAAGSPGFAIAGFILALIAIFCCWIPVVGVIFALVGLALSIVGVCKKRAKGLAIAGIVIAGVALIAGIALSVILIGAAAYAIESNVFEDIPRIIRDQIDYNWMV